MTMAFFKIPNNVFERTRIFNTLKQDKTVRCCVMFTPVKVIHRIFIGKPSLRIDESCLKSFYHPGTVLTSGSNG